MIIGKKEFRIGKRPYIMGILNVTPDSFSDGGQFYREGDISDVDKALAAVRDMLSQGADIIDVGGESTRPGHTKISVAEEIERTCFVIEAIKEHFDVPVSLDTYKSQVAQAGIMAGADMINDIWGLKYDEKMASLIAETGVACCLMHNRDNTNYYSLISDIKDDLNDSINIALDAGIAKDKIIIDPGLGFGKTYEQNVKVMHNLEKFNELGYPLLLGTSRKSLIGNMLELPVEEREEGTLATTVYGYMKGCSFFRVHNVKSNFRALKMVHGIMSSET
ncbi:MAG: dihydropteroate synthase [Lachnospiraceae bacterium]|nr:dihydropteroate synthase [Lachnospiraceae bacterium]